MAWNPLYLGYGFAALVAAALSALLLRKRASGGRRNAFLAVSLLVPSFSNLVFSTARFLVNDAATAHRLYVAGASILPFIAPAYLAFLTTLGAPITRPLERRGVLVGLTTVAALGCVLILLGRLPMGQDPHFDGTLQAWLFDASPTEQALGALTMLALLFGFRVALDVRRLAQTKLTRLQANWYLAAFGLRDVSLVLLIFCLVFIGSATNRIVFVAWPLAELAFAVLLVYAILQTQLFDVDLRVKAGLRRSLVGAVFLGAFLIASQLVQNATNQTLGVVGGAVASGLLLLALTPLQRAADRLASKAMPGVADTPEYRRVRSEDLYRAALEAVLRDGQVTTRERRMLAVLQDELGLSAVAAQRIEQESEAKPVVVA